jgi:carbon-monoxide dehydrogenase large subunit
VTERFEKAHPSYSFGAAGSVATVDHETGVVRVTRHVVAHDVGRAIDPERLHGQLAGAAAQGIGAALFEEIRHDADGTPLTFSLADYAIPTVAELPAIETIAVESEVTGNPLGAKGAGEAGMVGTPAAVANAVAAALGPAGASVSSLPLTPARVRALLRGD